MPLSEFVRLPMILQSASFLWHNSNRSGYFPLPRGMNVLGPTRFHRLNEAIGVVFLFAGLFLALSFVSYNPRDPSWDSVTGALRAHNLTGPAGAYTADFCLQFFGLEAFGLPLLLWFLAWRWIRSRPIEAGAVKLVGVVLLMACKCTGWALGPEWRPWQGAFAAGGVLGLLLADYAIANLNVAGTFLLTAMGFILSLYLLSPFSVRGTVGVLHGVQAFVDKAHQRWQRWRAKRARLAAERAAAREEKRAEAKAAKAAKAARKRPARVEESAAAEA